MYDHILIPTDGSELAQKGVHHGLSLANALGSIVTILTVTEVPFGSHDVGLVSPTIIDEYLRIQSVLAADILEDAQRVAHQLRVHVEPLHVSDGHPADCILATAATRRCSLIVMASHGRRGLGKFVLGSQTHEVLARSSIPVLVVR